MTDYFVELKEITKQQNDLRILNDFTIRVKKGGFHAILADNEASMFAVIKILSGEIPYGSYIGDILIEGKRKQFHSILDSEKAGIGVIYQKPLYVNNMDICDNIFLGNELSRFGFVNKKKCYRETAAILSEMQIDLIPSDRMDTLSLPERQIIEIAKCILREKNILVLEDLITVLTEKETSRLIGLLKKLKSDQVTIIYIGHRIKEILEVADAVTQMREGRAALTEETKNYIEDDIRINMLIGNELTKFGTIDSFCQANDITKRENEVLYKLIEGQSYKQICDSLFLSLNTIKTHINSIYQKTGANNRRELSNIILKFIKR